MRFLLVAAAFVVPIAAVAVADVLELIDPTN
jgi:hypothetical protein